MLRSDGPAFSYHPDKLSMERTENAAFGPTDRIGQLTMRNLDIADSRSKLETYASQGQITAGATQDLLGELQPGRAGEIANRGIDSTEGEVLDRAAMDSGHD